MFPQTYQNEEETPQSDTRMQQMSNGSGADYGTRETVFLLCNESASRFTVAGEMYKAHMLLEQGQTISNEMPSHLKATLFSNISCYYEK